MGATRTKTHATDTLCHPLQDEGLERGLTRGDLSPARLHLHLPLASPDRLATTFPGGRYIGRPTPRTEAPTLTRTWSCKAWRFELPSVDVGKIIWTGRVPFTVSTYFHGQRKAILCRLKNKTPQISAGSFRDRITIGIFPGYSPFRMPTRTHSSRSSRNPVPLPQ